MGKSPGKWIKTALFGKKTSKSHAAQRKEKPVNGKEKHVRVMASETGIDDKPREVPSSGLGAVHVDEQISSSEHKGASFLQPDQEIQGSRDQNVDVEQTRESGMVTEAERIAQEKAATKTQAAFRGYLARRAFKALRGIIRLQALIRGHLVRRQAVATLYSIIGIVKLQALVRGSRTRSDAGIEVKRVHIAKPLDVSTRLQRDVVATRNSSLSANAFIRKLLALSPEGMPLQIHYDETDSNSVQIWLERWSISCPWKPVSPPKKTASSKIQKKQGSSPAVEGAMVRPKRSVRKVPSVFDNAPVQSTSDMEKPRRNPKKVSTLSSHPADAVQENPQTELEKVKRSLRKVQNSLTESSAPPEVTERPPPSQPKTVTPTVQEDLIPVEVNPVENMKEETIFTLKEEAVIVPKANNLESSEDPVETILSVEYSRDETTKVKSESLEGDEKDENTPVPNGKLKPTAEPMPSENQKSGRRASLSAKQEHTEDGLQNTPRVPSYMQATKSAKAKLRAQGSPDVGQDSAELNNLMRRHSLSSPANGKVNSASPRTPKPLHSSGKAGNKNDKSLLSSREGNGKATQGWRR